MLLSHQGADIVLAVASLVLVLSPLSMAYAQWRLKMSTIPVLSAVVMAGTLVAVAYASASVGLWVAAASISVQVLVWTVLAVQSKRYGKRGQ